MIIHQLRGQVKNPNIVILLVTPTLSFTLSSSLVWETFLFYFGAGGVPSLPPHWISSSA